MKTDTKINNKHKLLKIRWDYWDNNALTLQWLDIQKISKIKAA